MLPADADGEQILENDFGKIKVTIGPVAPMPLQISGVWSLNFDLRALTNVKKKNGRLWYIDFGDGVETEYTYDGVFNRQFQKTIPSLADDLEVKVYKKLNGKLKLYGTGGLRIRDLNYGVREEKEIEIVEKSMSKRISHMRVQVALQVLPPGSMPFVDMPFCPMMMHAFVVEAFNLPKPSVGGLPSPYMCVKMEEDRKTEKTQVKSKTLTPQWDEQLHAVITNPEGSAVFELWDENTLKDKKLASAKVELKTINDGAVHFQWLQLEGENGEPFGKVNVIVQCTPYGHPFASMDELKPMLLDPIPLV